MRYAARLAAAAVTVAAAGVALPSPTQASTCGSGSGVTVVVDFHQLGGGAQSACDAGGAGEYADQQFADAGHVLTYVDNEPGFVCQVDASPDRTCPRTPPANAYWSLWWSDGKSGTWQYASLGVKSLKVPDGGSVALSWQGQSSQAKPRVTPPGGGASSPSSSPSPHPSSSPRPSTGPGPSPSSVPGSANPSGDRSTGSPAKAGRHAENGSTDPSKVGKAKAKATHGPDQTQAGEPRGHTAVRDAAYAEDPGSGGLPGWIAPVVIGVLFAGAGTVALLRRKRSGGV